MAIFFCCFPVFVSAENITLAKWTFPSGSSTYLNADGGIFDNLTQKISSVGTNEPSLLADGLTATNGWNSQAPQKYWLIPFSSLGYHHVTFSFKMGSSGTGPRDFKTEYRIGDSGTWKILPESPFAIPSSTSPISVTLTDIPLPEDASDQPLVFIRLLMNSNTSVNGLTIGTSGTNRLDDIFIKAGPLVDPEEEGSPILLCAGAKENVIISEILPSPKSGESEYVELRNSGNECVDLSGWRFRESGNRNIQLPENTIIEGDQYLTFIRNFYLNNTGDILTLFDDENEERSSVHYPLAIQNYSYSFNGSEWLFSSFQTPGAANLFDEIDEEEEIGEPGSGIIINEVFPNPLYDEAQNEFIELKNISDEEQSLKGWSLLDASQKIFTFSEETLIAPRGLLAIPRSLFSFSLNNTGTENVTLVDPQGNPVSSIEYSTTQEDFSYSFDGSLWHWTKKVTPGEENEFTKTPKVTLTSATEGYTDIPLPFTLSIKNGKGPYRYSWDFGDGRRSTLKEPRHTYEKTGSYKGSVIVRAQNGSTEKEFTIRIKKYPSFAVVITALQPNPEGKDTDKEWIEIKNLSQKNINLTGWKIATGNDELTNHPILPGLTLRAAQTLRITRKYSAFSLNNTASTIELRYPNNKAASRTTYEEKGISENATCANVNGRCDFKDEPKKEDAKKKESTNKEEQKVTESGSENNLINTPPSYPTKKELLQRIGNDFNLLINQLLLNSLQAKQS